VSFLQAERSLDSVLEAAGSSNPYSLQGRLALAQDAEKVTDFEGALVEYSCCLGLQQSADGRANFIRMKEAIPFGDLDNGQRDYNEALAILLKLKASSAQNTKLQAQNNVRTSFALAVVLTLLHRYQEAEQTMDTLVAQEKDSWQAFAGRGIILAEQGKFDDAIKSLNHALSLPHAHRGEIKPFLANVYISMGRLPEAERLLK
jgi:tetratricopeptide (TPR) repeat protein